MGPHGEDHRCGETVHRPTAGSLPPVSRPLSGGPWTSARIAWSPASTSARSTSLRESDSRIDRADASGVTGRIPPCRRVAAAEDGRRAQRRVRRPAILCQLLDATCASEGRRPALDSPHSLRTEHPFSASRALEKAKPRDRIPAALKLTRPVPPERSNPPATTGRTGLNPQHVSLRATWPSLTTRESNTPLPRFRGRTSLWSIP